MIYQLLNDFKYKALTVLHVSYLHTHTCALCFLYFVTIDSNKIRQLRRRKLGEEKKKLFEKIKLYNEQVADEERILEDKVESRLSVVEGDSGADCLIWPWEVHSRGIEQFLYVFIASIYGFCLGVGPFFITHCQTLNLSDLGLDFQARFCLHYLSFNRYAFCTSQTCVQRMLFL